MSEFSNFLLRVGEDYQLEDDDQMIYLDERFVVPEENISYLVNSFYGHIHKNYTDCNFISQRIIMCPKNETCNRINNHVIQKLPGEALTLLSADSVEETIAVNFPTEFLNSITPNGMPSH